MSQVDDKRIKTILLADGGDRQTLPLARAFHKLGYQTATLNASRLDNGYSSKYPNEKILDKSVAHGAARRVDVVEALLKTGKYDLVVTTSDETAEELSLRKERLKPYAEVAVVEPSLFYRAYDKSETMAICMENGVPCPKTYVGVSKIDDLPLDSILFPVVAKPKKSYGAIGFRRIDGKDELLAFCRTIEDRIGDFVFQEYIPQTDIQYECAMFIDRRGEAKTALVFSKNRWFPVDGGSSTCNVTVKRPDIVESCAKLLKIVGWRGPADIDLIQDPRDGVAKIIEINPRVSGSVKIVLEAGVNIAEQIVQLAAGEEVSSYLDYKEGVCLRCIHTDLLWFLKSPNRFKTKPSWFSLKNTVDQIASWDDPLPFFTFSFQALLKYRREMKKRER